LRRQIRIGDRVVTGSVCHQCPIATVIYPDSLLEKHLIEKHARHSEEQVRYRRGRTPGSVNKYQMSATGVEHKKNIRAK